PSKFTRGAACIDGGPNRERAVTSRNACTDPMSPRIDRDRKGRAPQCTVARRHWAQPQLIEPRPSQGQADQASSVGGHKVDGLRRDHFCRHDQVAFVLAILIIDDDNHASASKFANGVFNTLEGRLFSSHSYSSHCAGTSPGRCFMPPWSLELGGPLPR